MTDLRSAEDLQRDPQEKLEELPAFLDRPPKNNDRKELKRKAVDDKARSLKQENDLRELLATQAGIRFVARILGEEEGLCWLDAPAFHPNNSTMCNVAGRRQVGQKIKQLIRDVDFDLWVKVDRQMESDRKPRSESTNR